MNYINKAQEFMHGRYGIDELHSFLFKIYIGLTIVNLFINNKVLSLLELLLIIIIFYRAFSKKINKRKKENKIYIELRNEFLKPFINIKRNVKDKEYVYKKCPKCKKTLKLPIPFERGIKHTKCPNCKKRVTIFTLKKQKIEIIKNKK